MLTHRIVEVEDVGSRGTMIRLNLALEGHMRDVAVELKLVAKQIVGAFGPPKQREGARLLQQRRYSQDGRLVVYHAHALAHRGSIAGELWSTAEQLMGTLVAYERREAAATAPGRQ